MPDGGRITYLRCDGGKIESITASGASRPVDPPEFGSGAGMRHVAFKTDALDAADADEAQVRSDTAPVSAAWEARRFSTSASRSGICRRNSNVESRNWGMVTTRS